MRGNGGEERKRGDDVGDVGCGGEGGEGWEGHREIGEQCEEMVAQVDGGQNHGMGVEEEGGRGRGDIALQGKWEGDGKTSHHRRSGAYAGGAGGAMVSGGKGTGVTEGGY